MLKTVKLAHLVTLSSFPVPCSRKNLSFSDGSWIFRLANAYGCSIFFFFFERKVVQLAGKPFEGLTVDRLTERAVCALTVEPRRNQHCKKSLESRGKTNPLKPGSIRIRRGSVRIFEDPWIRGSKKKKKKIASPSRPAGMHDVPRPRQLRAWTKLARSTAAI